MGKRKSSRRFPVFANLLAGLYFIYSVVVYFGTFWARDGHEWWPLFLYPVIWPLSLLIEFVDHIDYRPGPDLNDYVAGALYIVLGTVWIWFLGWLISIGANKLFSQPSVGHKKTRSRSRGRR